MDYYIGLDLGTTAVKAASVSEEGTILLESKQDVEFIRGLPAEAAEIDPDTYFDTIWRLIRSVIKSDYTLKGITWAAASGNILFLDKDCAPVSPIYSWLDTRPLDGSIETDLSLLDKEDIYRTVGWPVSPQFPLGRLLWLQKKHSDLVNTSHRICMNNDYLGYLLTGKFLLDDSTSATFYLFDQEKKCISDTLLKITGVKAQQISPLQPSGTAIGKLVPEAYAHLGLGDDTPVEAVLGSFDHPSAARAAGLCRQDQLMLSCGTSWVGCMILPDRQWGLDNRLLIDRFTSSTGGSWMGMISLPGAGKCFDSWMQCFLNFFQVNDSHSLKTFDAIALKAPADHVPLIPVMEPPSTGHFTKLENTYKKESIARGILEAVVFWFVRLLQSRDFSSDVFHEILLVGGPSRSPIWPQIVSDMFNKPVLIRFGQNAGAVGAAMTAAQGTGKELFPKEHTLTIKPDKYVSGMVRKRYEEFLQRSNHV